MSEISTEWLRNNPDHQITYSVSDFNSDIRIIKKTKKIAQPFSQIDQDLLSIEPSDFDSSFMKSQSRSESRGYSKWSDKEVDNFLKGLKEFGPGHWGKILKKYNFNNRNSIDLSTKYRNFLKYAPEKLKGIDVKVEKK